MPVNRECRNAAAKVLASFMRAEIDRKSLGDGLERSLTAGSDPDQFVEELFSTEVTFCGVSKENWAELHRLLAFLKCDLEYPRIVWPSRHLDDDHEIMLARWHALGLVLALLPAWFVGWWIFVGVCALSLSLYMIVIQRHDRAREKERRAEYHRLNAFYPFATEEEWLAHRGVLADCRLPDSRPPELDAKPDRSIGGRILDMAICGLGILLLVGMVAVMYVSSLVIWPIWLVLMSLRRREATS